MRVAIDLVDQLPMNPHLLPAQVPGEPMLVLTRKAGRIDEPARNLVLGWADWFEVVDSP